MEFLSPEYHIVLRQAREPGPRPRDAWAHHRRRRGRRSRASSGPLAPATRSGSLAATTPSGIGSHRPVALRRAFKDKRGRVVPMNDCRKIYMVFAPRFERDGGANWRTVLPHRARERRRRRRGRWTTPRSSPEAGTSSGRRPTRSASCWLPSIPRTQITVAARVRRHRRRGSWPAGTRMKKLSPKSGFASDVEWRATISNIAVTGDASLKVGGAARADRGVGRAMQVHRLLGGLQVRRAAGRRSGGARATRSAPRPPTRGDVRKVVALATRIRRSTISTSGRSSTRTAARSASPWTA